MLDLCTLLRLVGEIDRQKIEEECRKEFTSFDHKNLPISLLELIKITPYCKWENPIQGLPSSNDKSVSLEEKNLNNWCHRRQGFEIHRCLRIVYFLHKLVHLLIIINYWKFRLKRTRLCLNYPICRPLWISNPLCLHFKLFQSANGHGNIEIMIFDLKIIHTPFSIGCCRLWYFLHFNKMDNSNMVNI